MYIPIKDAVRERPALDFISEAKKSAAFLYKYGKVNGSAKVSSLLNPLSPILRPGQLGYTEGVFNCISLAVPNRIMHTIPGRAIELLPKFFQGLSDDDMAEVLVAGGASSGEKVLTEVLRKINNMGIKTKVVTPSSDNCSVTIGVDPNVSTANPHGLVEYLVMDYTRPAIEWLQT